MILRDPPEAGNQYHAHSVEDIRSMGVRLMSQSKLLVATATALLSLACAAGGQELEPADHEPVVGGRCEGCANIFVGMPAELDSSARISPQDEPGQPLVVTGTVRDSAGDPVSGVVVYAYQTDDAGIYPEAETRHGRLRGWARTDADGGYRFDTIRPAGYPGTRLPQHIHMHVLEPGRCTYYIDDIHFTDDDRLTESQRQGMGRGRGGFGLLTPELENGVWSVTRDIELGANIPGYERCATPSS